VDATECLLVKREDVSSTRNALRIAAQGMILLDFLNSILRPLKMNDMSHELTIIPRIYEVAKHCVAKNTSLTLISLTAEETFVLAPT